MLDEIEKKEAALKKLFAEMNNKSALRAQVQLAVGWANSGYALKTYVTVDGDPSLCKRAVFLDGTDPNKLKFYAYVPSAFTFGSKFTMWYGQDKIGTGTIIDNR